MSITRLTTNGLTGTKYDTVSADNYYMEPIATTLLASGQAVITFSDIPQGYKHLQIRAFVRDTEAAAGTDDMWMTFNGDGGANYSRHVLSGDGASATSGANLSTTRIPFGNSIPRTGSLASVFGVLLIDILDYSNVYKFKTVRGIYGASENSTNTGFRSCVNSGLWMNTAPITSISMQPEAGSFAINTRISLYGIKG